MAKYRTTPPLWLLAPLWLTVALVATAPPLHAQAPSAAPTASASAAPSAAPSASVSASVAEPPAPEDVDVTDLRRRTEQIRALLDGTLEDDIGASLFDDPGLAVRDCADAGRIERQRLCGA